MALFLCLTKKTPPKDLRTAVFGCFLEICFPLTNSLFFFWCPLLIHRHIDALTNICDEMMNCKSIAKTKVCFNNIYNTCYNH